MINQMPFDSNELLTSKEFIEIDDQISTEDIPDLEEIIQAISHVEKLIQFVQQDNDDFCIDDQLFNNLIKLKKSLLEEALQIQNNLKLIPFLLNNYNIYM